MYHLQLTDATTVTGTRTGTSSSTRTINFTALEFASGVVNSLQRGTVPISSTTSADATIGSVDISRTLLNMPWFSTNGGSTNERMATAKLLNATTVRGERNSSGSTDSTPAYEVLEFL
jgi:hypothetical protein